MKQQGLADAETAPESPCARIWECPQTFSDVLNVVIKEKSSDENFEHFKHTSLPGIYSPCTTLGVVERATWRF
jgi:hypothetical protein